MGSIASIVIVSNVVLTATPIARNSVAGHSSRSHSLWWSDCNPVMVLVPGRSGDMAIRVSAASGIVFISMLSKGVSCKGPTMRVHPCRSTFAPSDSMTAQKS